MFGLTGLAAYRTGLNAVEGWHTYARLGPHTAILLIVLGLGLIWLAVRDNPDRLGTGPRWLWLPVVACSRRVPTALPRRLGARPAKDAPNGEAHGEGKHQLRCDESATENIHAHSNISLKSGS